MKLFGIVGWKNSGKTGLMERLVREFTKRGVTVSTIKHAHHAFDIDHPGRDSFRHREAGATEVAIVSGARWALMHELRNAPEPGPEEILARFAPVDLILMEGFKFWNQPKILCHRAETGDIETASFGPLAVASDVHHDGLSIPQFDLDATAEITTFIADHVGLS
ncbi:MAG: molybdopterin-guanine dinucleotide biosynthesis protein B [Pseudomonadota bacterium]